MFLIGPALLAVTHAGGSIYSADARQVVHKRPSITYAGVSNAIAGAPKSGVMQLHGGQPVPYKLNVERTPGERLVVHLLFDGREAARADVAFTPQDDGKATLMVAKVDSDGAVLRQALAGTAKAKLGYAPDWVFNFAMRSTLRDLAEQIEQGGTVADPTRGFIRGARAGLTVEEEQQRNAWRQQAATQPTLDPNAAAEKYLGGR